MADLHPPVVEETRPSFFSNLIAIVGLILLIVIVIWGLLHLAGLSQGWFSTLFNTGGPKVTVTAPAKVTSGEDFTVTWKYSSSEKGNYAFVYQCKNGLQIKSGTNIIPCGNAFTVGTQTTLTLTPTLITSIASTSVPISVAFLPSATSSKMVQGAATIIVENVTVNPAATPPVTVPPPAATPPASQTSVQTAPKTPADLSVRIIAMGVIDMNTGMFVNRPPVSSNEIAAAQFDISNIGGSTSGTYYFSANLPTIGGYVYNSPAQTPLAPGDHMINTLRWSQSQPTGTFTVTVTGDNSTVNNYAVATVGTINTYTYPQPTYYPQY